MTVVDGQVETLKALKRALRRSGVTRFNSVGELTNFQRNFETEKSLLPERIEQAVAKEVNDAQAALDKAQVEHKTLSQQVRADQEQPGDALRSVGGESRSGKGVQRCLGDPARQRRFALLAGTPYG